MAWDLGSGVRWDGNDLYEANWMGFGSVENARTQLKLAKQSLCFVLDFLTYFLVTLYVFGTLPIRRIKSPIGLCSTRTRPPSRAPEFPLSGFPLIIL